MRSGVQYADVSLADFVFLTGAAAAGAASAPAITTASTRREEMRAAEGIEGA
jgi:hypothetical protein